MNPVDRQYFETASLFGHRGQQPVSSGLCPGPRPPFLLAVPDGKSGTLLWWDSPEGKFQGHFAPEASRFSLSVILGQSTFPASRFSKKGAPVRSFHIFWGFHAAV
jgi:hypothetical protein